MEHARQLQQMLQVSYYLNQYGWYHVTLPFLGQQIAVSAFELRNAFGIDYSVEVGCREITKEMAIELGFVFSDRHYIRMNITAL